MGLLFLETLIDPNVYKCKCCNTHLANDDSIISRDFHGRCGRAYLFTSVVNITLGPNDDRHMVTGMHTVNDIYCNCCQQILGWRYVKAHEASQKYKEGKFILERHMMLKE